MNTHPETIQVPDGMTIDSVSSIWEKSVQVFFTPGQPPKDKNAEIDRLREENAKLEAALHAIGVMRESSNMKHARLVDAARAAEHLICGVPLSSGDGFCCPCGTPSHDCQCQAEVVKALRAALKEEA